MHIAIQPPAEKLAAAHTKAYAFYAHAGTVKKSIGRSWTLPADVIPTSQATSLSEAYASVLKTGVYHRQTLGVSVPLHIFLVCLEAHAMQNTDMGFDRSLCPLQSKLVEYQQEHRLSEQLSGLGPTCLNAPLVHWRTYGNKLWDLIPRSWSIWTNLLWTMVVLVVLVLSLFLVLEVILPVFVAKFLDVRNLLEVKTSRSITQTAAVCVLRALTGASNMADLLKKKQTVHHSLASSELNGGPVKVKLSRFQNNALQLLFVQQSASDEPGVSPEQASPVSAVVPANQAPRFPAIRFADHAVSTVDKVLFTISVVVLTMLGFPSFLSLRATSLKQRVSSTLIKKTVTSNLKKDLEGLKKHRDNFCSVLTTGKRSTTATFKIDATSKLLFPQQPSSFADLVGPALRSCLYEAVLHSQPSLYRRLLQPAVESCVSVLMKEWTEAINI